jgi:UDP-N-acetylmuramate--alanine ligase
VVYVAPVYAAGEDPIEGADAEALVAGLKARGHRAAQTIAGPDALADALAGDVAQGDLIVCLGAGDITKWAAGLAGAIEQRRPG